MKAPHRAAPFFFALALLCLGPARPMDAESASIGLRALTSDFDFLVSRRYRQSRNCSLAETSRWKLRSR